MALQNRVDPLGELFADKSRGLFMGNRGGRFHADDRTLTSRRWVSRRWICCRLRFNNRHRKVWGTGYTELFFLDEVTALSAGHRPCFECRRREADLFAGCWQRACRMTGRPSADEMDDVLHAERLDRHTKRRHRRPIDDLPDGAMVALGQDALAVRGRSLLRWTSTGYAPGIPRPRESSVAVLTPPAILAVLRQGGYQPRWHPSVESASARASTEQTQ